MPRTLAYFKCSISPPRIRDLNKISNGKNGSVWRFVSVYGSSYDEFKLEFINELHNVLACWDGPTLIGVTLILLGKVVRKVQVT
jgi:hypothetical protein